MPFLIALASLAAVIAVAKPEFDALRGPCRPPCDEPLTKRVGDIVLGGLFPVYNLGNEGCVRSKSTVREFGFERLEAMRFAVERINANASLLPGIELGYELRDTCSDADYALRQSLKFLNEDSVDTLGVVGAAGSSISIRATDLLNLFFVPMMSYASTSATLSDSDRYPSFYRSIPSDKFQASAMVAIAKKYGWSFVHGIHSDDNYGKDGFNSFKALASKQHIDIGLNVQLKKDAAISEVQDALKSLKHGILNSESDNSTRVNQNGSVVIMFCHFDLARRVLYVINNDPNLRSRNFTFIGSDSWGDKPEALLFEGTDTTATALGLISVNPSQINVPDYRRHMAQLSPSTYKTNGWFLDYWRSKLECVNETFICKHDNLTTDMDYDSKVSYVLDAVYAFAHALHNLLESKCDRVDPTCFNKTLYDEKQNVEKFITAFKKSVGSVNFTSSSGETFELDKNGDLISAEYDIKNLQLVESTKSFVKVGLWIGGDNVLGTLKEENGSTIIWHGGSTREPISVCSLPCGEGVRRVSIPDPNTGGSYETCWRCVGLCDRHHFLAVTNSLYGQCQRCPVNQTSNDLRTNCTDLPVSHLRWDDGLAVFVMILAVAGSLLIVFTLITFGVKWRTPLIMASSRELSVVMLIGMLLSYLLTFIFIAKPTDVTCGIQRFFFGVFLSVIFGALLVKTNRISRLFNRSASVQRPVCISPTNQLMLTSCIVLGACAISVVWLVIAPPQATFDYTKPNEEVVLQCAHVVDYGTLVAWIYIFGLILVCIVYAYKTRKIPENFKETLFINFAAYAELIIWLAFIPVGIVDIHATERAAFMCLAMTLTASAAWGCLFLPKLYIVLIRPERNIRQPTMRRPSRPSIGDLGKQYNSKGATLGERQASYSVTNHNNSSNNNNTTESTRDEPKEKPAGIFDNVDEGLVV